MKPLSPFMVGANRFAVAFQAATCLFIAVCYAGHPDPWLIRFAAWCFGFGVYSTCILRMDAKVKAKGKTLIP